MNKYSKHRLNKRNKIQRNKRNESAQDFTRIIVRFTISVNKAISPNNNQICGPYPAAPGGNCTPLCLSSPIHTALQTRQDGPVCVVSVVPV